MAKSKQDELARVYAMLNSLRSNIGQMAANDIQEAYVREFHAMLDKLEGIGIDVADFRISNSEVKPKITGVPATSYIGGGSREGHASYSKEKYVDKSFILYKLDTILGYFEIITSEKPKEIGFRTSNKK